LRNFVNLSGVATNQELPDDVVIFWHAAKDRLSKLAVLAKAYIVLPVALCGCYALIFKVWVGRVSAVSESVS